MQVTFDRYACEVDGAVQLHCLRLRYRLWYYGTVYPLHRIGYINLVENHRNACTNMAYKRMSNPTFKSLLALL